VLNLLLTSSVVLFLLNLFYLVILAADLSILCPLRY